MSVALLFLLSLKLMTASEPVVESKQKVGTVYYVSKGPQASNSHPGTDRRRPLLTIVEAARRVQPGDTVYVLDGDFRQDESGWGVGVVPLATSGTAANRIRFVGSSRARVATFLLNAVEHITVEKFVFEKFRFQDLVNWKPMPDLMLDVDPKELENIDYLAAWETRREKVAAAFPRYYKLIRLLEYHSAIDIRDSKSVKIENNSISGYWSGIQCRGAENIGITENKISHCVNGIYCWTSDSNPNALVGAKIIRNTISQSLDNGIDIRKNCRNVLIESNKVRHSGVGHISLQEGTKNCKVRLNDLSLGGYYSQAMQSPGSSGISLHSSLEGNVVEYNRVTHQIDLTLVDGNGIIVDLMQKGSVSEIRGNLCHHNMGSGLNTTVSPNTVVRSNVFVANGHKSTAARNGSGIKLSRDQDIGNTIRGNRLALNRVAGIISNRNLNQQSLIDANQYFSPNAPLIWDGSTSGDGAYYSLEKIRAATRWEQQGIELKKFSLEFLDAYWRRVLKGDFPNEP